LLPGELHERHEAGDFVINGVYAATSDKIGDKALLI
jgi:hypothetical protein